MFEWHPLVRSQTGQEPESHWRGLMCQDGHPPWTFVTIDIAGREGARESHYHAWLPLMAPCQG